MLNPNRRYPKLNLTLTEKQHIFWDYPHCNKYSRPTLTCVLWEPGISSTLSPDMCATGHGKLENQAQESKQPNYSCPPFSWALALTVLWHVVHIDRDRCSGASDILTADQESRITQGYAGIRRGDARDERSMRVRSYMWLLDMVYVSYGCCDYRCPYWNDRSRWETCCLEHHLTYH